MAILEALNCTSCGIGLTGDGNAALPCPRCGTTLARCGSCREQSVRYSCPSCDFQGP
jgi:Zn-ribbon RNA-binding protein